MKFKLGDKVMIKEMEMLGEFEVYEYCWGDETRYKLRNKIAVLHNGWLEDELKLAGERM